MEKESELEEFVEQFLEFERSYQLFDLKINDILVWQIIRFNIYNILLKNKYDIGQAQSPKNEKDFIKRSLKKVAYLPDIIKHNALTFKKEKEILIFNHQRKVRNNDYYECLYTDLIVDNLLQSNVVIEDPYMDGHFKPVRNKEIQYTDVIFFKTTIKRILKTGKKIKNEDRINSLIKKINTYFKVNLNEKELFIVIKKRIFMYKIMYRYYDKIIENIQPKILIQVVSYTTNKMILNSIAKKRNIPTVELQHGTMGKYHIAYNYAEQIQPEGFPDYIFTFGQYWKDNTRFPIKNTNVKVVGWPYYENKLKDNKNIIKNNEKKTILFVSQGTIGKELSKIAANLYEIIDKEKFEIIYKLHPGEYTRWRNDYPWLMDNVLKIIDNSDHDMHYYFAQADIQIGVYSTALFEGLGYDLKTLICRLPSFEYMEEIINNGVALLVEDEYEIKNALEIEEEGINKNKITASYFWENNSVDNILREINEIIKTNST